MYAFLRTKSAVDKLEIFLSREERSAVGHPNTRDNVILNKTSEWFPRSWYKVLVVRVRDEHCFGASNLVLW